MLPGVSPAGPERSVRSLEHCPLPPVHIWEANLGLLPSHPPPKSPALCSRILLTPTLSAICPEGSREIPTDNGIWRKAIHVSHWITENPGNFNVDIILLSNV